MNQEFTILFQKMDEGSAVKDSLSDFGIVCCDVPFIPADKVKDLPSNDWPGEDGDDTYFPPELPLKGYDLEMSLCYKGGVGTAHDEIRKFVDYLTGKDGSGTSLKIYSRYTGIGRQNVHFVSIGKFEFGKSNIDESLVFPVTFKVTDPRTCIVPEFEAGNTSVVVNLIENR